MRPNPRSAPVVVHAVAERFSKATLCGERPARGLLVTNDSRFQAFLQRPERCERCADAARQHRKVIAEAQRQGFERAKAARR